ncbi:Peroxiredoxin, Ohr subfamily (fragment) [uncultured Mycobacterium sp.]|uniref:Peroxiredoxin, Ohr subfamily n=1 Tax=uncultured Mycobacterium sp. TaxID=171292 RepID=A0A1Y5PFC0_9MYCO
MIDSMSIDVIYTAESTASGGGRDGQVRSSDTRIEASGVTAQVGFGKDDDGGNIDVTLTAKV